MLYLITSLNTYFPSSFSKTIMSMYNNYVLNNEHFKLYYSNSIFMFEIIKLILIIVTIFLTQKEKSKEINGYILLLAFSTLLMLPKIIVSIRYIMIIQLLGINVISSINSSKNKYIKFILNLVILIAGLIYMYYYIKIFSTKNFGYLEDEFYKSIFELLK
jgi:hypothetical protein